MSDPLPKPTHKMPRKRSRKPRGGPEAALRAIHTAATAGLAAYKVVKPLAAKLLKGMKKK